MQPPQDLVRTLIIEGSKEQIQDGLLKVELSVDAVVINDSETVVDRTCCLSNLAVGSGQVMLGNTTRHRLGAG